MVPNGARSRTARSPERREVPNDVKRRSELSAVWDSRSMGLRAVWDFAPFGTSRPLGLRAVWDLHVAQH
jgi:hypothetical protein